MARAGPIRLLGTITNVRTPRTQNERNVMSTTNIVHRVKQIIAEQLDVAADKIRDDSSFVDDLGADSLAVVEIVLAFEGEFGNDIPDEVTKEMRTVGDVIAYVARQEAA